MALCKQLAKELYINGNLISGWYIYDLPDHDAIFKGHPSYGAVFPKGASCTPQISPRPVKFADTLGETDETLMLIWDGRPIGSPQALTAAFAEAIPGPNKAPMSRLGVADLQRKEVTVPIITIPSNTPRKQPIISSKTLANWG